MISTLICCLLGFTRPDVFPFHQDEPRYGLWTIEQDARVAKAVPGTSKMIGGIATHGERLLFDVEEAGLYALTAGSTKLTHIGGFQGTLKEAGGERVVAVDSIVSSTSRFLVGTDCVGIWQLPYNQKRALKSRDFVSQVQILLRYGYSLPRETGP